jgi:glucosamine-6-phosphate deaminase
MKIVISENSEQLGRAAAEYAAKTINEAIKTKGNARIVLSTGASQFDTLAALIKAVPDWSKVEMFHLDEYIGLPVTHPASFRKYLFERFVSQINLKRAVFVNGEGDIEKNIEYLNNELTEKPIDLGLIGIGENGHIAFNDPPADLQTEEPYIVVNLNETCKKQQVREGWFPTINDVPKQAISMSVKQILKCKKIMSCVPHSVKAEAVKNTLSQEPNNIVPATMFKVHHDLTLFIDNNSAALLNDELKQKFI